MKKLLLCIASILLSHIILWSTNPIWNRLHPSLEWGYAQNIYRHHHFTMQSEEGYRIYEDNSAIYLHPNAFISLGLSLEMSKHISLGFQTGYAGIYENDSVIPLCLGLRYHYKDMDSDGFYTFAEAGIGLVTKSAEWEKSKSSLCRLGQGYRITLFDGFWLDFLLSARASFAHPPIPNPEGSVYDSQSLILLNNAEFYSICFSIRLSF